VRTAAAGAVLLTAAAAAPEVPTAARVREADAAISFLELDPDVTLRRMVFRPARARGTVILLHGFPETLLAWSQVAPALGHDYEVHAFDWPGYGRSSRPNPGRFSYAPREYARILGRYIEAAGIDRSRLVIYATDIGSLPALLLALEQPKVARRIVVGDFAPFDRPHYMYASLRSLKDPATADATRANMNRTRDTILQTAFQSGLHAGAQYELPMAFRQDIADGWNYGTMTSADAFFHYYAHFTRDQRFFEANVGRLRTPVRVVWGERDVFIESRMGSELAERLGVDLGLLPGVGHYPHLQRPDLTIAEIRAAME
jgi:pimeloyl-ACP methyl ester carboxylesterase